MYELRPYQKESVSAAVNYFKKQKDPAVIVLPTGAGKSLVIAELARIAKGRVLVLAHVKELVEQNHTKYESYGLKAGVYSAGLKRKDLSSKVIFGSIQSVARANEEFFQEFSLLIVDECHRISSNEEGQYSKVIDKLRNDNPTLCILGLTATPYRLDTGWIYEYHTKGILRTRDKLFFKKCIYELPLSYMIRNQYLTAPIKIDAPVACYDFSELKIKSDSGRFSANDIADLLADQERVTPGIIGHIMEMAKDREGVMIFTSSVNHAKEIMSLLPGEVSEVVIGETHNSERDAIIRRFKKKEIKFLVNVSVLTTGFDAPHVDLIALLRPTESPSLYQQIIGRGLRLSPGKKDCLILDYTGVGHNIFAPEVGNTKPDSDSEVVEVLCPSCGHQNNFWGKKDEQEQIIEHYGRKCFGAYEDPDTQEIIACDYRFRFKLCDQCGEENDIAARACHSCQAVLVDPDKKLREAMALKDAHVMRPDTMLFEKDRDKKGQERLEVRYYDYDGEYLKEYFSLTNPTQAKVFYYRFIRMHNRNPGQDIIIKSADEAIAKQHLFRMPLFIIARKKKYFWEIREKIF